MKEIVDIKNGIKKADHDDGEPEDLRSPSRNMELQTSV